MKRCRISVAILFIKAAMLLIGNLVINCSKRNEVRPPPPALKVSGVPPVTESQKEQYEKYQQWNSAVALDWMPDGRGLLVRQRASETEQLYSVTAPLDTLRQLTHFKESVLYGHSCPDPEKNLIVFIKDHDGDERFQLYTLNCGTMVTTPLTSDSAQNSEVAWAHRGDRFAWSSNRRNGKDFSIFITDIDHPAKEVLLLEKRGAWGAVEWSPDDERLLVQRYISRTNSRLYIASVSTGECVSLTDSATIESQELGAWGPDGSGIFYTSDYKTDFRSLRYVDCSSGKITDCTETLNRDVRSITLTSDRQQLVFTTNEDGFSQLYLMNTRTFTWKKIDGIPQAIIGEPIFSPDDRYLAMTLYRPEQPADVYVIEVATEKLQRWTRSDMGELKSENMAVPHVSHYPTFDTVSTGEKRQIPCIVYHPVNSSPPYPVLITIHGGPESQFWPSFKPEIQFYCNELGIAVLAPNVRGSGGYGKKYLTLDNETRREDAVRDIGALLDWIALQPEFDTSRIAVKGGSYGGYMVLASMVHYGNRLCAGIDFYGISNFVAFLENTSSYRRDLRRVEYGDERDPAMRRYLQSISPVTHAEKITKPLLIVQGAHDARVPLSESEQIAVAVRKNASPVWMVVAEDEGHGFRKKSNRDYTEWVSAMFLKRFLLQ